MDDDNTTHEVIERDEDTLPAEVEAQRKAEKELSKSMIAAGILVAISIVLGIFFLVRAIIGVQNQPETDVFAEYALLEEQREENITPNIEAVDAGFAGSYELNDLEYGTAVSVSLGASSRTIIANGIPNHETGDFPNSKNPNSISKQQFIFDLPRSPQKNEEPTFYNVPQPFGIGINGVIFDPFAAEYYNNDKNSGWQLVGIVNDLGFDFNNAHVQPDGTYHYHGSPTRLLDKSVQLIGFAGDGYPIYSMYGYSDTESTNSDVVKLESSYKIKVGNRSGGPGDRHDGTYEEDYEYVEGSGDLDECNGRFAVTNEYPSGTYHYVVTEDYPYIGRCHWAEIDASFLKSGPNR